MLKKQFLDSSRGRIAALLQPGGLTAEEIAAKLQLTTNAVRAQLAGMERDGLVRRAGQKRGVTRPAHVFELTAEVEQLLSAAYIPLLTHLLRVFSKGLRPDQVKRIMRQTGKSLAGELAVVRQPSATLETRVRAANELLKTQLGAVTSVARNNGGFVIRGVTCPLAAITNNHPSACLVMESFVHEIADAPVRECCDRTGRPRCCFEIGVAHAQRL
jgi:DeoR family transcriptional regulator, suf operon transcriptional repressor